MGPLRRRDFILGTLGTAFPSAGFSQSATLRKRIGVLVEYAEGDAEAQQRLAAFRDGLRDHGWIDGGNAELAYRYGRGDPGRIRELAGELAALGPDVILGSGAPVTAALRDATRTVPIVFVQASDPVGAGLVASLGRPGGNVTGFTNFEYGMVGKWLETLKALAPATTRVLMLQNPANFGWPGYAKALALAAPSLSLDVTLARVRDASEIEHALTQFGIMPDGGVLVLPDTTTSVHRLRIVELCQRLRLPAVYPFRFFAAEGGLVSYGIDVLDVFRRASSYVDRILRGERAADLPIQAPSKFELVINRASANALGLSIPPSLLALADDVLD